MTRKELNKKLYLYFLFSLIFIGSLIVLIAGFSFAEEEFGYEITESDYLAVEFDIAKASGSVSYYYTFSYDVTNLDPSVSYIYVEAKSSLYSYPLFSMEKTLTLGNNLLIDGEELTNQKQVITIVIKFYNDSREFISLEELEMDGEVDVSVSKETIEVKTFDSEKWEAPKSGKYFVELWGASGNYFPAYNKNNSGLGAYVSGYIDLKIGDVLYIYTGENANKAGDYYSAAFNGGSVTIPFVGGHNMSSGGGATDIRYFGDYTPTSTELQWNNPLGLKSRIMVAGGGGGTLQQTQSYFTQTGYGGAAGGLTGYARSAVWITLPSGPVHTWPTGYQTGGSQVAGGQGGGICKVSSSNGSFGKGGDGGQAVAVDNYDTCRNTILSETGNNYDNSLLRAANVGGGGGGGYYGGGGGSMVHDCHNGGAGGSSFISGHQGAVAIDNSGNPICSESQAVNNPSCSYHYSGLKFYDTTMIDGNGYKWTNTRGSQILMPSPTGGTYASGKGHFGSGAAIITLIEEDQLSEDYAGKITLKKYEKTVGEVETTIPIAGVVFNLYTTSNEFIDKYITDSSGKIEITRLPKERDYYFLEMSNPNNSYILDTTKHYFTSGDDEIFLSSYNKRVPGSVELTKKSNQDYCLTGAEFDLFSVPSTFVGHYIVDASCKINVGSLDWDDYYFVETSTLQGFLLDPTPIEFTIEKNNLNIKKSVINEEKKGTVVITKYNEAKNLTLSGAVYEMYKDDGTLLRSGLTTNGVGVLQINDIPWGSYYLEEVIAPSGYGLSDEIIRFSVNNITADIIQELIAVDPTSKKTIVLTKRINISDIIFDHGNPTFIFEVAGTDIGYVDHKYYREITITPLDVTNALIANPSATYIEKSVNLSVMSGTYTAKELETIRYEQANIINETNGIINGFSIIFELEGIEMSAGATFVNNKINQEGLNHATSIVNIIKARAQLTAIAVKNNGSAYILPGTSVSKTDLVVTAFYDDGTSRVLANSEYNLTPSSIPTTQAGSLIVTVDYTENDITRTTSYSLTCIEVSSITVDKQSTYTQTSLNQAIDKNQLTVTAYYSDGSNRVLENSEYSLSPDPVLSATPNPVTITVNYSFGSKLVNTSFTLNVVTLSSIAGTYTGTRRYNIGSTNTFTVSNFTITGTYSDGSNGSIASSNCSLSSTAVPLNHNNVRYTPTLSCTVNGITRTATVIVPVRVYLKNNSTTNYVCSWTCERNYSGSFPIDCTITGQSYFRIQSEQSTRMTTNNSFDFTNATTLYTEYQRTGIMYPGYNADLYLNIPRDTSISSGGSTQGSYSSSSISLTSVTGSSTIRYAVNNGEYRIRVVYFE